MTTLSQKPILKSEISIALMGAIGAFLTYFSMYAFRKPFTAGSYDGLNIWDFNYKILLVLTQVAGYMLSKFLGIKVVSELTPSVRVKYLLSLMGISWLALLFFAIIPYPYNFICLFFNGLPLGMIWGVVFSFLEGRKNTELLAAGMASSFIVSSGIVKSVGKWLLLKGVSEFAMPFWTGFIFLPFLFLGVWLLSLVPPPSEADQNLRTKRVPMNSKMRHDFFKKFAVGIIFTTLIYMILNAYRDFRDNFAVEIWSDLGYKDAPEILTLSELPIAISVLLICASMILIKNNRTAFYLNLIGITLSGLLILGTTFLWVGGWLSPTFSMILVGFGMYLAYMLYHTMLFERWIAFFKYTSNVAFLMYVCDSFGYLGSIFIMLIKNFYTQKMSWIHFFINMSYILGIFMFILGLLCILYFYKEEVKRNLKEE